MLRFGEPPYLECSTKGDRRFSAFCAVVDGRSIEETYQAAKVFEDGTTGLDWRAAKGRRAVNADEVRRLYITLWRRYVVAHPELLDVLCQASGLSDVFGQPGSACQAEVLWRIRGQELARRGFKSTVDSWNRRRDAERLAAEKPLLTERGRNNVVIADKRGVVIARGYTRVVFGDHGPYIEMTHDQVDLTALPKVRRKCDKAYYDELRTDDGAVLVYDQRRDVRNLPNPPRGPWSASNNRPEGYADYKVGMMYVDPDEVVVQERNYEEEDADDTGSR